jgi:hypothetical protein
VATLRSHSKGVVVKIRFSRWGGWAVVVTGYLVCDAIWLLGKHAAMAGETIGPYLRNAAWLAALLILIISSIAFGRRFSVLSTAAMSGGAVFTAAVPILATGFFFFPAQFPMDTEPEEVAMRVLVELSGLCIVAAILAAVIALSMRLFVRYHDRLVNQTRPHG